MTSLPPLPADPAQAGQPPCAQARGRRTALWLLAALVPLSVLSLMIGAAGIGVATLLTDPQAALILTVSRLPRTMAVILTGAALAIAGVVMQQLVRNRFVEPGTTGTSESAALGLLAVTILAPAAPIWVKMVVSSLCAMAGTALFLRLMPEVPAGHPALGLITLNFAANGLGLDNAATPIGLKAMKALQELNPSATIASTTRRFTQGCSSGQR